MASSSLLPRILLVTAIALTAVAGVKNYMNRDVIKTAKTALDQQADAQNKIKESNDKLAKAVADAKAAQEKVKALEDAKASGANSNPDAALEIAKAKKEVQEAKSDVQAKETEIANLKKQLDEASAKATPTQDPALASKLAEAEKAKQEADQVLKALQTKSEESEKKVAALEAENVRRVQGLGKPGLEGKILAVNPNWNFVVLSIGDKQGVAAGSSLIVKRGGGMVAKLRVTSVEPSTSIADIQVGSLSKGNSVQAGDVVIFPGS